MTNELRVVELAPGEDAARFALLDPAPSAGIPQPSPANVSRLLVERDGALVARAALHLARDLAGAPGVTGMIGYFEATDVPAGAAVVRAAAERLRGLGAERVLGPMNGSTWARYRLALPPESGEAARPPFLSEPTNPEWYPVCFDEAGFAPVSRYLSRLAPLDSLSDAAARAEPRVAGAGIRIVPLEAANFAAALDELYDLSVEAFASNPYYSPLPREAFRQMYEPMRPLVDYGLVLLARGDDDRAVGFMFGFPDLLDPAGRPTRFIIKTLAVANQARGLGLGTLLMHEGHRRAGAIGMTGAIHALMHEDNPSHRISRHGGDVYRRYALYGWQG